jgi:AraC family transcriptional regulator of adaptative response/methylated-DNA-[protein]-cysteine methyltransferase
MPLTSFPTLTRNPDDYERVAAAIRFLQTHRHHQPDLRAIAQHLHLSESDLHQFFYRWVGVSPERFFQQLTVAAVQQRLATSRSLFELSEEIGLSRPSRLHDEFVKLEALSPGEYRAGGRGITLTYGMHPTRFGPILMASTPRGICHVQFLDGTTPGSAVAGLQQAWPQATLIADSSVTQPLGDRLNQSLTAPPDQPLTLLVKGTNFQIQVWRALLKVPFGHVVTYQDIANHIGNPQASRAVGTAIGANAIAYLIPCHRVIRSTGELGGYRWGVDRKASLLGYEACYWSGNAV